MEVESGVKIFTNGAKHWAGQLPRIEAGFRSLGHETVNRISEADLVYSNNSHEPVLAAKRMGDLKPGAKLILTCLDVPTHLPDYDPAPLAAQLRAADAVCTISQFGWRQLQDLIIDSTVIYQPIKPVRRQRGVAEKPLWRFLHCGRRFDGNKRYTLGERAVQLLGYQWMDLLLVGNEQGWGDWRGVLDDRALELAYNSVDFVLCPSRLEGLCLPVIEAMAAGVVPVVCRDMTTRTELLPPEQFPEYEEVEPTPESVARFIARLTNEDSGERLAEMKERLHAHYLAQWQDRTSPVGVARAILNVYETLT